MTRHQDKVKGKTKDTISINIEYIYQTQGTKIELLLQYSQASYFLLPEKVMQTTKNSIRIKQIKMLCIEKE